MKTESWCVVGRYHEKLLEQCEIPTLRCTVSDDTRIYYGVGQEASVCAISMRDFAI